MGPLGSFNGPSISICVGGDVGVGVGVAVSVGMGSGVGVGVGVGVSASVGVGSGVGVGVGVGVAMSADDWVNTMWFGGVSDAEAGNAGGHSESNKETTTAIPRRLNILNILVLLTRYVIFM
jgi:hypothetical protein